MPISGSENVLPASQVAGRSRDASAGRGHLYSEDMPAVSRQGLPVSLIPQSNLRNCPNTAESLGLRVDGSLFEHHAALHDEADFVHHGNMSERITPDRVMFAARHLDRYT